MDGYVQPKVSCQSWGGNHQAEKREISEESKETKRFKWKSLVKKNLP